METAVPNPNVIRKVPLNFDPEDAIPKLTQLKITDLPTGSYNSSEVLTGIKRSVACE
jgi:hypothetical protein